MDFRSSTAVERREDERCIAFDLRLEDFFWVETVHDSSSSILSSIRQEEESEDMYELRGREGQ